MKRSKVKKWFQNIALMLRPVWKQDKLYFFVYIMWDCIYGPLSTMLYVFLMQIALDQLSSGAEINTIAATLFFFFICELLLSIGGTMLFSLYFNQCRVKIIASVNTEICEHIKYTDYRYFDDPDYYDEYTVSYAQYANKSMEAFERFSGMLSTVITIGTLIGYIMSSTIYAILITFVSVVIKVLIDKVINKIDIKKEEESAPVERRSGYYRGILCSRDAAMDIKSTNIYQILMEHYRRSTQQGIEINLKYGKKTTRWSAVQDFALQGSSLAIRMIVCGMIFAGKVGVGSFVSLLSAANSLAWKIQGISKIYAAFDKFALYGEKIKHFMNQPCAIEQQAVDKKRILMKERQPFSVVFDNVGFSYENSSFLIKHLSFSINKGQKIAIVGENGCGKTTLTKLLLRLYDPNEGEIMINGIPLKNINLATYRANVGIAFQDSLVYSLPLRENMSAYQMLKNSEDLGEFSESSIGEILKKNDATLDTDVSKYFFKDGIVLSGGEKQQVAVSRLFTKEFGLLIFDEPSSALDPFAEEKLNQMIFDRANKTTTILISHRLSNVVKADCIYVMKNGEIVEKGTHAELLVADGVYSEMFLLQAKNYQKS